MKRCSVDGCKRRVEFSVPKRWCARHWHEWFLKGSMPGASAAEIEREIRNAIRRMRRQDRKTAQ
jgi:hypothetical protein